MKKVIEKKRKKEKFVLPISDFVNIIMAVLTFLSVIGVGLTLHEMKIERNATFKPRILINPTEISFSWDDNGNEERVHISEATNNNYELDENGNIGASVSIPITYLSDNKTESFDVVNFGVGNARDIVFEWHNENIINLNNYLKECNPSKKDFLKIDKSAVFDINGRIVMTNLPTNYRIMYMSANAQENYKLTLPTSYSILIHEIIKSGPHDKELPFLILTAKYFDVQDKEYMDVFLIQLTPMYFRVDETGSGEAIYQLIPAISKGQR